MMIHGVARRHIEERSFTHRTELDHALTKAFAELEATVAHQRIRGYGVATWSGFAEGVFTVLELVALASKAAGSQAHHLTSIQLPASLVHIDPIASALDGRGPLSPRQPRRG
jgi:hypothetical protein